MAKGWFFVLDTYTGTRFYRVAIEDEWEAREFVVRECGDGILLYTEALDETGIEAGTVRSGQFFKMD